MVTPAQTRALEQIADLVDVSKSTLPASVWADPTIRPYVPSHYELGWDQSAPDPSKLPSPAREALQNALQHKDQGLTIEQTRALLTAFAQSGVKLAHGNHANGLGFNVPGVSQPITVLRVRLTLPHSLLQNSQRC
jgi:hypothetical protein